jgi:hypothetical protein
MGALDPSDSLDDRRGLECALGKLVMDVALCGAFMSSRSAFFATVR